VPRTASWVTLSRPFGTARWQMLTQHCVLGYFQPSLAGLLRLATLPPQTQPVSLVGEAYSQKQHAQEEKTKHAVPLALVADAV
jgi:hypothetical protein